MAALSSCRLVLWRRHFFSRATPVIHMSLLWEDGLHRDVPTGACHFGACRDFHRGGEYMAHIYIYFHFRENMPLLSLYLKYYEID